MFPITCVVKYSIYFVTGNILSFQMKTYNQQILQHRQDERTSMLDQQKQLRKCKSD